MKKSAGIAILFVGIACMLCCRRTTGMNAGHYMRVARLIVDSAQIKDFYAALREGMATAVRKEPGVLNLWAVAEKDNPTHITVFEIYADEDAYKAHIQTAHFKKYKKTVQNMVKALQLVDVVPIGLEGKL